MYQRRQDSRVLVEEINLLATIDESGTTDRVAKSSMHESWRAVPGKSN
jgi:hypothetical protein